MGPARLCLCVCVCVFGCAFGCVQMCALVQMGLMGPARLPDLLINTSLPPCLSAPPTFSLSSTDVPSTIVFVFVCTQTRVCLFVCSIVCLCLCLCVQLYVCVCVFPLPLCLLLPHFTFFNHKHILQIRPGILRWSTRPFSP